MNKEKINEKMDKIIETQIKRVAACVPCPAPDLSDIKVQYKCICINNLCNKQKI